MPLYYHAHRLRVFLAAGSAPGGCEVADKSRVRSVVDLVTTVLVALTACVALVKLLQPPSPSTQRNRPEPAVPTAPIPVGELPRLGSEDAPLGLIVFSDFECPACQFWAMNMLPTIKNTFVRDGTLQVFHAHHPLERHQRAVPAAAVAECAGSAGQFWPMHDLLFAEPKALEDADFQRHWSAVGLQAKHLDECRPTKESRLRRMADGNKTLQIQGTPTLFLGQVTRSKTVLVKKRWTGVISAEVLGDSMKQLGNQPVER